MVRPWAVLCLVLGVHLVGSECRAATLRANPLSPGPLELIPSMGGGGGGGDGAEQPPLEPGRMTLEALCGIPALLIASVPLLISDRFVRPTHPLANHLWNGATLALVIPTLTAALQTAIGNTSSTTRVRFLPPWLAGLAIQVVASAGAEVISQIGHITNDAVGLGITAGLGVLTIFGTPVVQMIFLNNYRTARPLEESAALAWPEAPYASAAQSRGMTLPLVSLRF